MATLVCQNLLLLPDLVVVGLQRIGAMFEVAVEMKAAPLPIVS